MGGERQGPKSSGYGGFLQLFDWNAKSRKKLFSSKSDFPDHPRQQKKSEGNFPTTRIRMLDEGEIGATSSIKESSDYSCASSVTDEEGYASKAPGVVARLMGLDSLPTTSNSIEPYSSPFFDTQSLNEALFRKKELHYIYEAQEHQKPIRRPIEKFQTENLPPKSAKSIPITQHKLLSPIKKPGFVQYNDVAHIMEAAARIIEPGPQVTSSRTRISSSGSSSVPLKVRELKEKMNEVSRRPPLESNAAKSLKRQPLNNSGHKGKSINLAIQAKVNVQTREGLNPSLNNIEGKKEVKITAHKKPSVRNSSQVLKQNNQKHNGSSGKENVPCTKSLGTNNVHGGKAGSKKSGLEGRDNQKNVSKSGQRNVPRKKRIIDGNLQGSRNEKNSQSNSVKERHFSMEEEDRNKGADVVSFTFSTPMKESNNIFSGNRSEEFSLCQENMKLASPGYDVVSESLSILLEQKLRELTDGTEPSNCSSTTIFGGSLHDKNVEQELQMDSMYDQIPSSFSSTELENPRRIYDQTDFQGGEMDECSSTKAETRLLYNRRHPSPVTILDSSDELTESCNSSDSTGSNMTNESKQQCSSENLGLSDSASSTKGESCVKEERPELPVEWELDYIKDILSNVELMFKDYATGRTREIINPHLFDQMERKRGSSIPYKDAPLVEKKALFDCVRECLDWRCQRFIGGGFSAWEKGLALVRNKERLVEDVYKEIQEWRKMKNCMVDDELMDKDMSIVHGRWLDFEADEFGIAVDVETQIFDCLVAEVAAHILGARGRLSSGYTSILSRV